MSRKLRWSSSRSHSPQTHNERDLREHFERRAQEAILGEDAVRRKLFILNEYNMELRIIWVAAWAWITKATLVGSQSLGKSSSAWESTFACRIGDEGPYSSRMLCKKLPRIWRIDETLRSRWNKLENTEEWNKFYSTWLGIAHSESNERSSTKITRTLGIYWRFENLQWSWQTETVRTFFIKLLLLRVQESVAAKLECFEIHEWIWVFLENCQHARRDPDELHNDFLKFGDIIGDAENRRNWEKWERRTIAINACILLMGKRKTKKSRQWKVSYVFD